METSTLLKHLHTHAKVKALAKAITDKSVQRTQVGGLQGSSAALVLASIAQAHTLPPIICIMNDQDDAGYFFHDLTQMLGEENILFFPSSYKRAIKYNQRDEANVILRTEVLTRLKDCTGKSIIVVTYPDALAEKVVSERELEDNTLTLSIGSKIEVGELERRMIDLGMKRVDYVYELGQFAIRGSIVDIYSYSAEIPYRVDFFGNEIDSIRTFDVQSQLSENKVETMTIVPQLAQEDKEYVPVFEFMTEDTRIICRDLVWACDRVGHIYDEGFALQAITENAATGMDSDMMRDHIIMRGEDFTRKISAYHTIELRNTVDAITFCTKPQPLFHKNFEMVKSTFQTLLAEGYRIHIFSDSDKQIQRLQDIFEQDCSTEYERIHFDAVLHAIHDGFIDETLKECFFTDHQLFDRFHKYNLKSDKARRGKVALTLKELQQFEVGDYVVHLDHGVGRFGGLVRVPENDTMVEKIKINYQNGDSIYVSIHALHKVSKYKGKEGEPPRINRLGGGAWERMKEKVKTKVKDIARDLIRLYAERRKEKGFAYSPDSYLQHELEASFTYEDTPDQFKATQDVKADMESQRPMDRLVCGDVGFGKTEVAIRAAFKAATDSKQVAVLVPTTVLAYQHYQTFMKRLKDFPVRIEYLSRARTAKQQKEILADLAAGKVDIIIGTHKLVGKSVKFHDLGLLIIDEEQKFGVAMKEKLRQAKVNVDTLTMTATPIPRTLQFSMMGARDLSSIMTPPPNRYPIQTEIHTFSPEVFAEAINFEMSRNGQVFIVNNRVNNLNDLAEMIHRQVPDARICIGHGRMNPEELEHIILDFMNYDYDVMISTTIVENGIDVPNANTIIINSANNYGLSDLHQMRGRVGRGNRKAFCYLIAPPLTSLPDDSRRRLQAIENFSDLGSGIHIAMQDLDIRGAGNMLGAEQSGFIADLGYEAYQKVLNEAVAELRQTEFADLINEEQEEATHTDTNDASCWVDETNIESDLPAFFPEEYVPVSGERMALYRELDGLTSQRQIDDYRSRLIDRFGSIPTQGEELLCVMPLKWVARQLGIEKITLKQGRMALYLPRDQNSPYYAGPVFMRIINYATHHARETRLRDGDRRSLLVNNITSVAQALEVLKNINSEK